MILVLSATGAPVALVKTFDVDISHFRVAICVDDIRAVLKGTESLTPQYRSDLLNPSEGEINSGKLRSRKQFDFLAFVSFFSLVC